MLSCLPNKKRTIPKPRRQRRQSLIASTPSASWIARPSNKSVHLNKPSKSKWLGTNKTTLQPRRLSMPSLIETRPGNSWGGNVVCRLPTSRLDKTRKTCSPRTCRALTLTRRQMAQQPRPARPSSMMTCATLNCSSRSNAYKFTR